MGAEGARYMNSTCKTSYRIIFNRKEGASEADGLSEAKGGMRIRSERKPWFPYSIFRRASVCSFVRVSGKDTCNSIIKFPVSPFLFIPNPGTTFL